MSAVKGFIKAGVELAPLTSWRVGGQAEFYCTPRSLEEVEFAMSWAEQEGYGLTVLGGGSNVLISDAGISGLVLSMRQLVGIEVTEKGEQLRLTAMAGTHKSQMLRFFLQHRLAPALFLSGLPGDLGGGIVMNAGVSESRHPREFCELIDWVEVVRIVDGKTKRVLISAQEMNWTYRHSWGWQPGVIVRAGLSWPNQPDEDIAVRVREVNRTRLLKQPLDLPSGGSVFVNPPGGISVGIDRELWIEGISSEGSQGLRKHANFVVNVANATAADIDAVIRHVQERVLNEKGLA